MADGTIKIAIEVDGKPVTLASKELDNLEESGKKSGRGLKAAEESMDDLADSSAKAGKSVKGASDAVEDLGDRGSKASKDLKGADSAIDGLADSSADAASNVKGASDSLDSLGDSGSKTSKELQGAESTVDELGSSSEQASRSVQGATSSLEGLSDSGVDAGRNLGGADQAIDELAGSSAQAASDVQGASSSLDGLSTNANAAGQSVSGANEQIENTGQESNRAAIGIKELAVSLGLVALASKVFDVLKSSLDAAISRFDTLNAFPVVMEQVGFSAEDSTKAINRLSAGIDGLPTTLDTVASTAQRMAVMTSDLEGAVETTLALNNAFISSSSDSANAARGLEQYIQMLAKGEVDLMSWRTLQETMGVALNDVAKAFSFAGTSAQNDLYDALKDGTITFEQFNAKIIELDSAVGGFAERAKTSSGGIATSLGNLRNSAARGVAGMIDSFNTLSRDVTGKEIAENIDSLKVIVNQSFKVIGSTIERATPFVKGFTSAVGVTLPVVKALSPAIFGLVAAYGSYVVITKMTAAINTSNAALAIAQASQRTLTVVTNAQIASKVAEAAVEKAVTAARARGVVLTEAQTAAIAKKAVADKAAMMAAAAELGLTNARSVAIGVLTGKMALSTAATLIKTAATTALGVAIRFMLGPMGLVITGIGLLTAATIAIVKWFNKATVEGERLNKQTEKLAGSTESLNSTIEESSKTYEKNQKKIETNAEAYAELAAKANELAAKEKLTAEEKKKLNSYIEELNRNVDGLNLAYGEQSNALSASSEQILNRINLMKEEEKLQSAQERLTEIMKEQIDIQKQLHDINVLREEWKQKLADGTVKSREHKNALEELEAQEKALEEAAKTSGDERVKVDKQIIESSAAVAAAAEKDIGRQAKMLDELSEAQQKTVENMKSTWEDYKNAATDMFDTLSEKSELSVSEMTKNLEKNQEVITKWSENIAKLAERGVDEGLLNTLRDAGPESAGHVNALVKASDKELEKLSDAFSKGGEVATSALSKSLGIEESGMLEALGHLIIDTEKALQQQIANADFEEHGIAIPEGLGKGINKEAGKATKAARDLATDVSRSTAVELGINSPSRVFKEYGVNITEGLVLGINNGTSSVIKAIQDMFKSVQTSSISNFNNITKDYDKAVKTIEKSLNKLPEVTQTAMKNMLDRLKSGSVAPTQEMKNLAKDLLNPFNGTKGQFNSIGQDSMAGLNQGLLAGKSRVMSTANSIANEVARTMQRSLRIHSPSRIMKDKVGKWIPEGIAVGIRDNAKSVYRELDNLSKNMIMTSTPEQALGTSRMAYSSAGSQFVDVLKRFPLPSKDSSKENSSFNLAGLITAIESLASRPISVAVEGREIARVTHPHMTEFQQFFGNRAKSFRGE